MKFNSDIPENNGSLEAVLIMLAKECLVNKPENVEKFCLEVLAGRQQMQVSPIVKLSRGLSLAVDENLCDVEDDIANAKGGHIPEPRKEKTRQRGYQSSDESELEEVRSVASYHSHFDDAEELGVSDVDESARVKTAKALDGGCHNDDLAHRTSCYLFSKEAISSEELERETKKYSTDKRMKSLFKAWDGDDSGAVDFVELVLALHKFEQVAHAGIDIQVASDALLEFVESETERELKFQEFCRVIILFALNNFNKNFNEVADHMLEVARGTSEAAVLHARTGRDTSEIEAADMEETAFLRETVKCMEDQVTDNIQKLRSRRVAFRQGSTPRSQTKSQKGR